MKSKTIAAVGGLITGVLITVSTVLFAGQVTIPHSFTAGTPARASEVNANFNAIENAVNDNASAIEAGPQIIFNDVFGSFSLSAFPGATVASLTLPPGTYVVQAKIRYRNTGTQGDDPACFFQLSDGTSFGSLDVSTQSVPPGEDIDGFMVSQRTVTQADDPVVRVNCSGSPDTSVVNPTLWATRADIVFP